MTGLIGLAQSLTYALALQAGAAQTSSQTPPQAPPEAAAQTRPVQARPVRPRSARSPGGRGENWTWMLYEGDGGPLVLANEIPDTPRLRATLECAPGSSIARLVLYGAAGGDGYATVRAGSASAEVEARARGGRLETAVRADHPVFAAFLSTGRLTVAAGEHETTVDIERADLPKLRRFAELCTG